MITKTFDDIRKNRAKFAREVEYVKETAIDDVIDERVERAHSQFVRETIEELEEAADMVQKLSVEDEIATESTEIQRLLDAEENITFNEMVGIQ